MDNPKQINLQRVKQAANEFLHQYHPQQTLPVPIEDIVEIGLKIQVILINGLIRICGVNAFITQSFDSIVVDESMFKKQPERIRFTLAEEVGHMFLHKEWYLKDGPKGMENYIKWQEQLDGQLYSFIERQAKTFAGMILMPEEQTIAKWKEFAQRNNLPDVCGVYDLTDTFPELAHEFAVSPDSLLVRLSSLKLVQIPDGFWIRSKKRP